MTVTFVLSNGETPQVPNSLVSTSNLITSLMADANLDDVEIDVPDVYTYVFHYYINVLNNKHTIINDDNNVDEDDETNKLTVDKLLVCFNMESFFADDMFFDYLLRWAYRIWDSFYSHINVLPSEHLIYLHTPYEFVPTKYMNRPQYFKQWLQINQDIKVKLNTNDIYYTIVGYYNDDDGDAGGHNQRYEANQIKYLEVYHTTCNINMGREIYKEWYRDGQPSLEYNYVDDIMDGLQLEWYENNSSVIDNNLNNDDDDDSKGGKLKYIHVYVRGLKHGLQLYWYKSGRIMHKNNYLDGIRHGLQQTWYDNKGQQVSDQLESECNYDKGLEHGLQLHWYNNGKLKSQENYIDGKKHGFQETWTVNDGILKHKFHYTKGKLDGIQKAWNDAGQFIYQEIYDMGKLIPDFPYQQA